ncbi:STAS domain-containing protein [Roseateles koreensis]|uniref:STAS domain-containing protein n=1 Tax=Roseateles koreensis TaxID=2987526 RepID=A0ABT5KU98_9BURK|nr:STAS domain-containing protein [Roseateles koreensis]MDC8786506.1 STAS domain-containing protein [Roseateles koreensis]
MTEPKDGESFFRKVARFVANPTTDWAEINSRQDDPEGDQAKAELRAMVDRKRRNDFVRKRELDMLRRIRREGLTAEQLAALGSASSRMDDIERNSELNSKIDLGVKAKIDQIEQQMVGENFAATQNQNTSPSQANAPTVPQAFFETSTRPVHFAPTVPADLPQNAPGVARATASTNAAPSNTSHATSHSGRVSEFASADEVERMETAPPPAAVVMGTGMPPLSGAGTGVLPNLPNLADLPDLPPLTFVLDEAQETQSQAPLQALELAHDAELDEAVIAFANADYDTSEHALSTLIRPGGARTLHSDTWLVLFDLYRATGRQAKFEALALEFAEVFGRSAPQWFSLPKLVSEAQRKVRVPMAKPSSVSWAAPTHLTLESVQLLKTRSQLMPMPWVMDWTALERLDTDAAESLQALFREWAGQALDMRWIGGDHWLRLLADLTPVSVPEVNPVLWRLRLDALRLVNRPDQFDEAAIDYCVTYEVSPPSWERSTCRVRISQGSLSTQGPSTSITSIEPSSSFMESQISELGAMVHPAELALSGQLSGDISELLRTLSAELGAATLVHVSCATLIRLDFMAAGDLLNWVLSRQGENRQVTFVDAHRLVALFFAAMGINEHARIKIRQT